ncbi:headcase protein homolog [Crassostrea virginica]|uniref:Headcase protein-like n=1 Tax=Crassostrea virginica TaxID=6565 RepID=A0A8B8ARQ9_CRAVI|nr:headcase protein-like [Crassostrea virginica]
MPHHKHNKNHKGNRDDTNNNVQQNAPVRNANVRDAQNGHREVCCAPTACLSPDENIDIRNPGDAVRVFCNNDQCTMGNWMHGDCFIEWEDSVLAYLKSCGRARSWSEKQRLQNLWTKKGYDLAFKACDCKCGRGHLRKDLNYLPPPKPVDNVQKTKKKHKKKNDKPMAVVSNGKPGHSTTSVNANHGTSAPVNINHFNNLNNNSNITATSPNNGSNFQCSSSLPARSSPINTPLVNGFAHMRLRTNSCESAVSTGSSPPNSAGSTGSASPIPQSPVINGNFLFSKQQKAKFDCPPPDTCLQAGAYFRRRVDMSAFSILPKHKQNPYHIKMEEDSQGNDETRSFVLTHLSSYKVSALNCVLCKNVLPVFDRYPMIDGTFFLSPQAYDESVVQVISDGRLQFINAVCVSCLEGGSDIRCAACKKKWDGSTLLLGTMYSYDIFAAMPCCQKRLTCKHCRRAVVDVNTGLSFYSEYSHMIACPYCKAYDYHFIRPMSDTFVVKQPIWN